MRAIPNLPWTALPPTVGVSGKPGQLQWDAGSGQHLLKIPDGALVHALAFSPDGSRLATAGNDKAVRVWDVASGQQLLKIAHDTHVHAIAFSPDGSRLATGGRDKRARIWMLEEPHG
jgi:WD40 repeat protein